MKKQCVLRCLLALVLTSMMCCAHAHSDTNKEYQLKAAYLLNFARFIYWPEEAFKITDDKFNICVFGGNPFEDYLDKLSNKKIQKKNINLIYANKLDEITSCHIVYFSETEKDKFENKIKKLPPSIMLTVSGIEGFSEGGGMIEFVKVNNRIKFEINVGQSSSSGIKYRSQLLEVAERLR